MQSKSKRVRYKTLISVLANGATSDARKLLIQKTGKDAKNISDLEVKLSQMYVGSEDKIALEKAFAEIHPHKDFLLKYASVSTPKKEEKIKEETVIKPVEDAIKSENKNEQYLLSHSNNDRTPCRCHECNMRILSNADGSTGLQSHPNKENLFIASIAIVAILAIVVTHKKHV